MLRAVLSVHECERVVGRQHATYLGEQFPKLASGSESAEDFALLSFHPDETPAGWRAGYYRLDFDLTKLNEALFALSR